MKIHGYCETCRRVRRVHVNNSGMARLAAGSVPSGVCDACQQAEDDRRAARFRSTR